MPFYLRKQHFDIPPPTEKDWLKKDEEENFFLNDPDQLLDSLPQPFCMINKILKDLFERAWDRIEERRPLQETKQQSFTPLLCYPTNKFMVSGRVNCLSASEGYIFIGHSTGISVFSSTTCENLCTWEVTKLEICTIQLAVFCGTSHLLGTVDEMGFARLFLFVRENLLHIKSINEMEDISKRNICMALELSPESDYAGFLLQGSSETWLEIYRLPKDAWQKETEHLHAIALPGSGSVKDMGLNQLPVQEKLPEKSMHKNVDIQVTEDLDLQQLLSKIESKLLPPVLLLKVRPPKPLSASTFRSPFEALMKSDEGHVIGMGYNTLIRDCQVEWLQELFNSKFQQYLEIEDDLESKEETPSCAKFHFHLPGRTFQTGTELKTETDTPVAFSVHWSNSHNLCFYFLSRPPKEKPDSDPKPDIIWPCAAPIVYSTLSSCASYFAFVCEDKAITLWDTSVGFPLCAMILPENYTARNIQFMPRLLPSREKISCCSKDPAHTMVQLLVLSTDGSLYLLTSGTKEFKSKLLGIRPEVPDQTISAVATIPTLPDAVLIFFWIGVINLMDTTTDEIICRFMMAPSYKVASPWQPVFSMDTNGRWLAIQGESKVGKAEMETIFIYDFSTYSFMETFAAKAQNLPAASPELTWDRRCDLFLNNNLQRLSTISQQMPECWSQLQEYAATLKRKMFGEVNVYQESSFFPRTSEEILHVEPTPETPST
ncbi:WD repeat-containing protein 93 [Pseudonaja textilis]|uniref:WD repeat-containing protein 93 n=1 Tax=Pseudonaja textilis TaxID=8673 RepID=UPI000EA9F99F|nr:WD repeat-containing protein 93 [Pseudonaja textilis]